MHISLRLLTFGVFIISAAIGGAAPTAKPVSEEPLPEGAIARLGNSRFHPRVGLQAITVAPDQKYVIGATDQGLIHLWDWKSGQLKESLRLSGKDPVAMAVSHDSKILAVALSEEILLYSLEARGEDPKSFKLPKCTSILFSPDDRSLATIHPSGVDLRSSKNGDLLWSEAEGRSCVFSRDGKKLWIGTESGKVVSRNLTKGEVDEKKLALHAGKIDSLDLSYQGTFLTSSDGKSLKVIDLNTGQVVRTVEEASRGRFLPNQDSLLLEQKGILRTLDPKGKLGEALVTNALIFTVTPDGKQLLALDQKRELQIIDLATGRNEIFSEGHSKSIRQISPLRTTPKALLSLGKDGLGIWEPGKPELRSLNRTLAGTQAFWLSSDQKTLAVINDYRISVYRDIDWSKVEPLENRKPTTLSREATPFNWLQGTNDDRYLLYPIDKGVGILDLRSMKEVRTIPLDGEPQAAVLSSNDRVLAVFSTEGILRLFSLGASSDTKEQTKDLELWSKRIPRACKTVMAFSPDGLLLAVGNQGRVQILETITGRPALALTREFAEGNLHSLAFSEDGELIAAGFDNEEGLIRVWEVATGKTLTRLIGHRGSVNALSFASKEMTLNSGGADQSLIVWDLGKVQRSELKAIPLDDAWKKLDATDIRSGSLAVRAFIEAGPTAIGELQKGLKKMDELNAQMKTWMAQLDSEEFRVREQAKKQLLAQGEKINALLHEALANKNNSPEKQKRLEALVEGLSAKGQLLPEGLFGEALLKTRLLYILERSPTPESREMLLNIAKGSETDRAVQEAKAILGRIKK